MARGIDYARAAARSCEPLRAEQIQRVNKCYQMMSFGGRLNLPYPTRLSRFGFVAVKSALHYEQQTKSRSVRDGTLARLPVISPDRNG